MNLGSIQKEINEIIKTQNKVLHEIEILDIDLRVKWYLRERVYEYYKPGLDKAKYQFDAIQEFMTREGD